MSFPIIVLCPALAFMAKTTVPHSLLCTFSKQKHKRVNQQKKSKGKPQSVQIVLHLYPASRFVSQPQTIFRYIVFNVLKTHALKQTEGIGEKECKAGKSRSKESHTFTSSC